MNALELPESTQAILEGIRAFAQKEVIDRAEKSGGLLTDPRERYDAEGRYTEEVLEQRREIRRASAREGFFHMCVPEELGGGGEGALTWFAAWEELFRTLGAHYLPFMHDILAHWTTGPSRVWRYATPELREQVLPELMAGDKSLCFAMSEPEAGSDVWQLSTRAVPEGDGWRITGVKQWATNGPYADYALLFAITDPEQVAQRSGGISAFIVPADAPGYSLDSVIKIYGHVGGHEGILRFEDVKVGPEAMLGEPGQGLRTIGFESLSLGRLYNCARIIGLSRWALEQARVYAQERTTFGEPIIRHQGVSFQLAEAATELLGIHLMALHAARLVDDGTDALVETSMAKMQAAEAGGRIIDKAIQVHGAMGLTNELALMEAYHHVRGARITDGTSEMLRRLIAGRMARGPLRL